MASPPDPNPPATDNAASRVFSTPELLELVLLNLPTQTLFGIQRTCRAIPATINASIKLQRRMFLRPDTSAAEPEFNPLLVDLIFLIHKPWLMEDRIDWIEFPLRDGWWEKRTKRLHFKGLIDADLAKCEDEADDFTVIVLDGSSKHESWRRTLISNIDPEVLSPVLDVVAIGQANFREWNRQRCFVSSLDGVLSEMEDIHDRLVDEGHGQFRVGPDLTVEEQDSQEREVVVEWSESESDDEMSDDQDEEDEEEKEVTDFDDEIGHNIEDYGFVHCDEEDFFPDELAEFVESDEEFSEDEEEHVKQEGYLDVEDRFVPHERGGEDKEEQNEDEDDDGPEDDGDEDEDDENDDGEVYDEEDDDEGNEEDESDDAEDEEDEDDESDEAVEGDGEEEPTDGAVLVGVDPDKSKTFALEDVEEEDQLVEEQAEEEQQQ